MLYQSFSIILFAIIPTAISYHVAISSACMSHLYGTLPLSKLLVEKGHKVTYVTSNTCKERVLEAGASLYLEKTWNIGTFTSILSLNPIIENYNKIRLFRNWSEVVSFETYQWVESLKPEQRPDVLMSHPFCYNISTIADYFNIPFVSFYSNGISFPTKANSKEIVGDVSNYISDKSLTYQALARVQWTVMSTALDLVFSFNNINEIRKIMKLPSFSRYYHLVRSYPTICPFSEPFVKHGHVEELYRISLTKYVNSKIKIDADVIDWLNNSDKPVIYMALGTSTLISDTMVQMLAQAFDEQSDFRILWSLLKRDSEINVKTKSHVLIKRFLPQISIFQRKEIVGFITHCGAASILEATSLEIPFIFFPQGRDQYFIAKNANNSGIGVYLKSPTSPSDIKDVLLQFKNRQIELHKKISEIKRSINDADKWEQFDSMIKALIKDKKHSRMEVEDEFDYTVKIGVTLIILTLMLLIGIFAFILYACIKCFSKGKAKLKKN